MTLILAIPTNDGVVIGSDTQVTAGDTRYTSGKIKAINSRCLWAAAGDLSLIQRVEQCVNSLEFDNSLIDLRDDIGTEINECIYNLLQLDTRSRFLQNDPNSLLALHPGDFIFAEYSDRPIIISYSSIAIPTVIDRPHAIGIGASFAYALLKKYDNCELNLKTASIVSYKVLDEAIAVGGYGVGHPIDIWNIDKDGAKQLENQEYDDIFKLANALTEAEVELLDEGILRNKLA